MLLFFLHDKVVVQQDVSLDVNFLIIISWAVIYRVVILSILTHKRAGVCCFSFILVQKNAEKVFFIILTHGKQWKTITKAKGIEWC